MSKSDFIRREHENTLLHQGYICVKTDTTGTQTWADMTEGGPDIYHHTEEYDMYVEELGHFAPTKAEAAGARYFTIHHENIKETYQTAIVSKAIAYARTKIC